MTPEQLGRRRAIEALRSGVPSWAAVSALGSGQSDAEDRFTALLEDTEEGTAGGLLLGAGFGAGKTHVLTHLAQLATDRGFAVSTVVISKETPLHDPGKVFRAALASLTGPGRAPVTLPDALAGLDTDTPRYTELTRWLNNPGTDIDERFPATVFIYERLLAGKFGDHADTLEAIGRFWAGEPIAIPVLKRALRALGAAGLFTFTPISVRDLARQRIAFTARLLRAGGYTGWVLLFDEIELIGRYPLLARGRSYAELARWARGDPADPGAPIAAVLAITDDYDAAVLTGRGDRATVPGRLRDRHTPEWAEIADLAEAGITAISNDILLLRAPDDTELDRAYRVLKDLHGQAYDWAPPEVPGLERLGATRMRQHVRAWINAWDLLRLNPGHQSDTEVLDLTPTYTEDPALTEDPTP